MSKKNKIALRVILNIVVVLVGLLAGWFCMDWYLHENPINFSVSDKELSSSK